MVEFIMIGGILHVAQMERSGLEPGSETEADEQSVCLSPGITHRYLSAQNATNPIFSLG